MQKSNGSRWCWSVVAFRFPLCQMLVGQWASWRSGWQSCNNFALAKKLQLGSFCNLYTHVRSLVLLWGNSNVLVHVPKSLLCFCHFVLCFHCSNWKNVAQSARHTQFHLGVAVRRRRLIKNCLLQVMDVQHGFDFQPSVPGSQSKAKQRARGTFVAFPGRRYGCHSAGEDISFKTWLITLSKLAYLVNTL